LLPRLNDAVGQVFFGNEKKEKMTRLKVHVAKEKLVDQNI
jgi:phosphotransferase system IIB component